MNATTTERNPWRQSDGLRQEIMAEIRKALRWKFHYIDVEEAEVLLVVPVGLAGWVAAIGHPSDGSYEWAARDDGAAQRYENSDCGYGCSSVALRDGLVKMTQ